MKQIGLFAGIGGFEYAASLMAWETIAVCEIDKFCQKILKHHFPKAILHGDIKTTDFTIYRGKCDIITGGFPCQPYSVAGKRKGKDDERHLWPEMLRAIREVQPAWVVGENVSGIVNWSGGLVFDEVQTDLETEGYEVLTFILPAAGVNAPHKRDRVWFVAYSDNKRASTGSGQIQEEDGEISKRNNDAEFSDTDTRAVANPDRNGKIVQGGNRNNNNEKRHGKEKVQKRENVKFGAEFTDSTNVTSYTNVSRFKECWPKWGTSKQPSQDYGITSKPGIRRGDDGFSYRVDRLKSLGNAIVPQVALQIYKSINEFNNLNK